MEHRVKGKQRFRTFVLTIIDELYFEKSYMTLRGIFMY